MMTLAEQNALVEKHLHLATTLAKRAKRYVPDSVQLKDLIQEGALALVACSRTYDPAAGRGNTPFDAYARRRVFGAMIDSCRRRHYLNAKLLSLELDRSDSDRDHVRKRTFVGQLTQFVLPRHDEALDAAWRASQVGAAVALLTGREQDVMSLYYRYERTGRQIGRILGITESRVGLIRRSALAHMRRGLEARGLKWAA